MNYQQCQESCQSYKSGILTQNNTFPERFQQNRMFGQPINSKDQVGVKDIQKGKNYGDIQRINQINQKNYNMKNGSGGNTYQGLYFSKCSYLKNRESSLDDSFGNGHRQGRKIANNSFTDMQPPSTNYYQQKQNLYRQQNYGSPSNEQNQFENASNNRYKQNNENIPQTTICDFYRNPSVDDGRMNTFSPTKIPQFVPEKVSCKKRFDEHSTHDTTIVQLVNRTSETGFINDTPSKRQLKTDTLEDSYNNLFNQQQQGENYRPGKRIIHSRNGTQSIDGSIKNYQFRNVLTGAHIAPERQFGLGIVDKSNFRRDEIPISCDSRQNSNSIRNNYISTSSNNYADQHHNLNNSQNKLSNSKCQINTSNSKNQISNNNINTPNNKLNNSFNQFNSQSNNKANSKNNNSYQRLYTSNIFFRDDLPSRENSAQKNQDGLNNRISSEVSQEKFRQRKAALYNSNHVRGCLDHSFKDNTQNQNTSKERSLNRIPASNVSNNMSALMIQHDILKKQPKEQQDLITQILCSSEPQQGKLVVKDRNQSPITRNLLKNEKMGTPQRFLLPESTNKISSKHQHNSFSKQYAQPNRNYNSNSLFN